MATTRPKRKNAGGQGAHLRNPDWPYRFDNIDKEKLREMQSRGGKASVEARRKRKQMKEDLALLLDVAMKPGKLDDMEGKSFEDLKDANLSVQQKLMVAAIAKAATGNTDALEFVRDTVGEKPVDRQEHMDVTPTIITGELELED